MATPIATASIVRQAFRFMEVTPPSSVADSSEAASDANEQYPIALNMCLEQEDFSFARRFATLQLANTPEGERADPDMPFFYPLPADFLKLRSVAPKDTKWRIDGRYLLADSNSGISIRYTKMIDKEARLPATFQTAVSYQLANLLAPTYVGSRTKRADLVTDGATALRMVIDNDAVSASASRWDGQPDQGDWASEATR